MSRKTTFIEKKTQKTSEPSPSGIWSSSTKLAKQPLMSAEPLGMPVFLDTNAKGRGMLPWRAA